MSATTELKEKAEDTIERAASSITSISSAVDPMPHFTMSAACGIASILAYTRLANPTAATIAAGIAIGYAYAGSLLLSTSPAPGMPRMSEMKKYGTVKLGYDIGAVASIALLAAVGPRAWNTGEVYSTALASLAGFSTIGNVLKSYQVRTGKPREGIKRTT